MKLHSSEEWSKIVEREEGIIILDADGWDRSNFDAAWNQPITKKTFDRRLAQSTIRITRPISNEDDPCTDLDCEICCNLRESCTHVSGHRGDV